MIIENVDAFKGWLAKTLTPICDAEPIALAKYIVALVKKDKPEQELKNVCLENLEVFLQSHTRSYVDKLFESLNSRLYLLNDASQPSPSRSSLTAAPAPVTAEPPAATSAPAPLPVPTSASTAPAVTSVPRQQQRASDEEISDDDRDHRRRSPGLGSRTHSGDREKDERLRWSRNDDRPLGRRGGVAAAGDKYFRHDRRKRNSGSPHSRTRSRSPARNNQLRETGVVDRNCNWTSDGSLLTKSKNEYAALASLGRRDNGVIAVQSLSAADTVSPVPVLGSAIPSVSSLHNDWPKSLPAPYTLQQPPPMLHKARCRDFDEKGFCMRGDLCSFDHGSDPVVVDDISNMLPFPSGKPPQPGPLGLNLPMNMTGPMPMHQRMSGPSGPVPNVVPSHTSSAGPGHGRGGQMYAGRGRPRPPPPHTANEPYNPEAPSIRGQRPPGGYWNGTPRMPRMSPQMSTGTNIQAYDPAHASHITRNVITIQRVPDTENVQEPRRSSGGITDLRNVMSHKRPMFRPDNRDGFGDRTVMKRPRFNPRNATIEVKQIPSGLNSIAKLNEHFVKFGNIVSLQVAYEGDLEAALITFSQNSEASAAVRSSEPVFNNRFIKVLWHHPGPTNNTNDANNRHQNEGFNQAREFSSFRPPVHERLALMTPPNAERPDAAAILSRMAINQDGLSDVAPPQSAPGPPAPTALAMTPTLPKSFNPAAMRLDNKKEQQTALVKRKEESKKEIAKKQLELQKQKQVLLQKQLEQQKVLIVKAQQMIAGAEKEALMKAIRNLITSTDALKKELTSLKPIMSREQAAKEVLDTELEIYTRQVSGQDAAELATKLAELKRKAKGLGIDTTQATYGRGGSFVRGRGRGRPGYIQRTHSEEKPRRLLVIGFKPEEKDDVITHFNAFGALEDVTFNEAVPSLIVSYHHAGEADAAAKQGAEFNGKRLIMKWHRLAVPPALGFVTAGAATTLSASSEHVVSTASSETALNTTDNSSSVAASVLPPDDEADLDEELLLAGDDDDDDDTERRSWR